MSGGISGGGGAVEWSYKSSLYREIKEWQEEVQSSGDDSAVS